METEKRPKAADSPLLSVFHSRKHGGSTLSITNYSKAMYRQLQSFLSRGEYLNDVVNSWVDEAQRWIAIKG